VLRFPTHRPLRSIASISLALCVGLAACQPHGGSTSNPSARALPTEGQLASLPLGALAGAAKVLPAEEVSNPLEGNPQAIAEGKRLFVSMNCAGCHGYDAAGNMGPNLTDKAWRYGGTPSAIYQSIFQGRPQGMPSWGRALPAQDIWKLVSFIGSLGGSYRTGQHQDWLNGDHGVTSTAPEVTTLEPTFNVPTLREADKPPDTPLAGGSPTPAPGGTP
jgi:cytochrome c oxidase cbb3-type subunit 3